MKSVLMIAYDFPPEGHAGVYRPLRFVRHLASFGWRTTVVTAEGNQYYRYDPELLKAVPADTEIVRAVHPDDVWQSFQRRRVARLQSGPRLEGSAEPGTGSGQGSSVRSGIRAFVRRAESWWYHPDMQANWIRPAVEATLAACARHRPDVLWATGPPWSAFMVARQAAQRAGIPYVLDFRTSWTVVPSSFEAMRPAWAQRRDRNTLRDLLKNAQAVTFFYAAEAECFWRMYQGALDVSRIHIIPNGFDGDVEPFVPSRTEKFTILYTGTLSDYRYDTFLEALATFTKGDPARRDRISVKFVGEQEAAFFDRVRELGVGDVVSAVAPMSHAAIGALQRNVDALLMLERKPSHKGYELLAGAKLFGYLRAGRPILGVVPPGEAERILHHVGATTVADAASVEAIHALLETTFAAWHSGRLSSLVPDPGACASYSAKNQTAALTRALDGVPAVPPFVPGAVDVVPSLRAEFAAAGWA
jgi:glycosyltransferase involved in cell wall biosynthesis